MNNGDIETADLDSTPAHADCETLLHVLAHSVTVTSSSV